MRSKSSRALNAGGGAAFGNRLSAASKVFTVETNSGLSESKKVSVTDITYIRTYEGWL